MDPNDPCLNLIRGYQRCATHDDHLHTPDWRNIRPVTRHRGYTCSYQPSIVDSFRGTGTAGGPTKSRGHSDDWLIHAYLGEESGHSYLTKFTAPSLIECGQPDFATQLGGMERWHQGYVSAVRAVSDHVSLDWMSLATSLESSLPLASSAEWSNEFLLSNGDHRRRHARDPTDLHFDFWPTPAFNSDSKPYLLPEDTLQGTATFATGEKRTDIEDIFSLETDNIAAAASSYKQGAKSHIAIRNESPSDETAHSQLVYPGRQTSDIVERRAKRRRTDRGSQSSPLETAVLGDPSLDALVQAAVQDFQEQALMDSSTSHNGPTNEAPRNLRPGIGSHPASHPPGTTDSRSRSVRALISEDGDAIGDRHTVSSNVKMPRYGPALTRRKWRDLGGQSTYSRQSGEQTIVTIGLSIKIGPG